LATTTTNVVDGGKARIILKAFVTPADVMDNTPMLDLLHRVSFRWHLHPRRAIADAKYGTIENISALEELGIRAYMPIPNFDNRTAFYGPSQFHYDADADVYWCPQRQSLPRYTAKNTEAGVMYRADAAVCNACPVKTAWAEQHRPQLAPIAVHPLPRTRQGLPRNRGVSEGDAQAWRLGRTAVRRGQRLARLTPLQVTWFVESEL